MYHPPSKKKLLIRRIVVYSVMSLTVVSLVYVLVLVMLGYRFDQSDGKLEQGGLVQFDTVPDGAQVTVDDQKLSSLTPNKATLSAGQHYIGMQREGYQPWQKTIDLTAGSVLWLKYARLIPTDLQPTSVADFSIITDALASPNKKWMALKGEADTPVIRLADLSRQDARLQTVTIPDEALTAPNEGASQTYAFSSWDASSRYLLVKHSYNEGAFEWILVDTSDPSQTKNLTTRLGEAIDLPVFSKNDGHTLYARVGNDVRRIDASGMTLSGPLVRNVSTFSVSNDDVIVYATQADDSGKQSVGYLSKGASKAKKLQSFEAGQSEPLRAALGTYFGDAYVAIVHNGTFELFEGNLPRSDEDVTPELTSLKKSELSDGSVTALEVKTDGRFVLVRHGSSFTVYDLELQKETTAELHGAKDGKVSGSFGWLDGYTLWNDAGGMVHTYEFDGANQHDIMKVVEGMDVTLNPDEKYIYGITKAKDTYHLTRVQIIL